MQAGRAVVGPTPQLKVEGRRRKFLIHLLLYGHTSSSCQNCSSRITLRVSLALTYEQFLSKLGVLKFHPVASSRRSPPSSTRTFTQYIGKLVYLGFQHSKIALWPLYASEEKSKPFSICCSAYNELKCKY